MCVTEVYLIAVSVEIIHEQSGSLKKYVLESIGNDWILANSPDACAQSVCTNKIEQFQMPSSWFEKYHLAVHYNLIGISIKCVLLKSWTFEQTQSSKIYSAGHIFIYRLNK